MSKITILDIFGNPLVREGEVLGRKMHGYEDNEGSWRLYPAEGWTAVEFLEIRWKRKRKSCWIQKSSIISIKED